MMAIQAAMLRGASLVMRTARRGQHTGDMLLQLAKDTKVTPAELDWSSHEMAGAVVRAPEAWTAFVLHGTRDSVNQLRRVVDALAVRIRVREWVANGFTFVGSGHTLASWRDETCTLQMVENNLRAALAARSRATSASMHDLE